MESSPKATSLSFSYHSLLLFLTLCISLVLSPTPLNYLFLSFCHSSPFWLFSVLTFPSICPLNPLLPCLCHPFITTGAVPSSALAWVYTHQAFLMLLHSAAAAAAAATVSSFPLSPPCASCFYLQGSWVCHWPTLKGWYFSQMSDKLRYI